MPEENQRRKKRGRTLWQMWPELMGILFLLFMIVVPNAIAVMKVRSVARSIAEFKYAHDESQMVARMQMISEITIDSIETAFEPAGWRHRERAAGGMIKIMSGLFASNSDSVRLITLTTN